MTIRSSSPASKPLARLVKEATAKRAFQLGSTNLKPTDEAYRKAYEWCYHWLWWTDVLNYEFGQIVAEASGNPSHWFHTADSVDFTQRVIARVMTKARDEQWVPFNT